MLQLLTSCYERNVTWFHSHQMPFTTVYKHKMMRLEHDQKPALGVKYKTGKGCLNSAPKERSKAGTCRIFDRIFMAT